MIYIMDKKDFEKHELLYREYAKMFWNDITAALWSNRGAFKYLPIVFLNHEALIKNGDKVYGVTHIHINTATNVATIYPVIGIIDVYAKEEIELAIRHEAIHYLLGILYKCHDDCSALFWLVCDCFEGNAYSPMNSKSQKVYELAKPYIVQIYEMYRTTKNEKVATHFALMLTVIDNTEADPSPNFDEFVKSLVTCIDAAGMA